MGGYGPAGFDLVSYCGLCGLGVAGPCLRYGKLQFGILGVCPVGLLFRKWSLDKNVFFWCFGERSFGGEGLGNKLVFGLERVGCLGL